MKKMSCEQLEIDTKDICLLCLRLGSEIETNCFASPTSFPSLQGFKHLLRYLKVSPKELFNCSTEFLQSMEIREDIDLKISLCPACSSVTHKFNKLYQQYELIQLQFGNCVQSLYQSISEGNEIPERVRKYNDQMRPTKSSDLVNASIAANLRNETLKKCFLKLQSLSPRVKVAAKEQYSKLPLPGAFGKSSTPVQEHETTLGQKTKPLQNPIGSQFIPNKDCFPESVFCIDDDEKLSLTHNHQTFMHRPTEETSDIEVIAEVKSADANVCPKKKGYFNSIRKKLKTNSKPTATAANSTDSLKRVRGHLRYKKICEYCKTRFSCNQTLKTHIFLVHPEHVITKYLPVEVPLEHCTQSVHAVWEQMYQISGNNNKCPVCSLELSSKDTLKRHLICSHAKEFAMKVFENIQLFPEYHNLMVDDLTISADTGSTSFSCEYCNSKFSSTRSLCHHKSYTHPEHIVYKFFPPHMPLDACRQGLNYVFEEMLKKKSSDGFKCDFCAKVILQKESFKSHVVHIHGKEITLEALQRIGLFPEHLHLEDESSDLLASSTHQDYTSNISTSADPCEFGQSSMLQETDFETEENVKLEVHPQEILGLDFDTLD